jgi:hypothetical protein
MKIRLHGQVEAAKILKRQEQRKKQDAWRNIDNYCESLRKWKADKQHTSTLQAVWWRDESQPIQGTTPAS